MDSNLAFRNLLGVVSNLVGSKKIPKAASRERDKMKRGQFNTRSDDGTVKTRTGYLFDWLDIPDYHFAIYQASNIINSSTRWIVIELSTGLAIGGNNWQNGQTRKQAIIEAKEILMRVGKIGLDNRIQEVLDSWTVDGKLNKKIAC